VSEVKRTLKHRIVHEAREYLVIFLYLFVVSRIIRDTTLVRPDIRPSSERQATAV
jgi:hypothetical protein